MELEQLFGELEAQPEAFVEQVDTERFSAIRVFIMLRKARTVSWDQRTKLREEILTHLATAKELQAAPAKKSEPKTPKLWSGMGKTPMSSMLPFSVALIAMSMRANPEQIRAGPDDLPADQRPGGAARRRRFFRDKQESDLPPDVQKISGVTTLTIPGPPSQPVLSAELRNAVFNLEGESLVDVGAVRLYLDPLNTLEVPLALALKYSKDAGFAGGGEFTKAVEAQQFSHYQPAQWGIPQPQAGCGGPGPSVVARCRVVCGQRHL